MPKFKIALHLSIVLQLRPLQW